MMRLGVMTDRAVEMAQGKFSGIKRRDYTCVVEVLPCCSPSGSHCCSIMQG